MRLNFAMHAPIMGREKATNGLAPASASSHSCVTQGAAGEGGRVCRLAGLSRIHK